MLRGRNYLLIFGSFFAIVIFFASIGLFDYPEFRCKLHEKFSPSVEFIGASCLCNKDIKEHFDDDIFLLNDENLPDDLKISQWDDMDFIEPNFIDL